GWLWDPGRGQAPRTVASPPRDSTRRIFVAVSASPPCAESEASDGSALRRLLWPRRVQGQRHRLSPVAGRWTAAPPGGAHVRHLHPRAAAAGRLAQRRRLHPRHDGVDRHLVAARLQAPGGELRAVGGERAACEDGAGPQDGRARQRVARPAPRARPAPPELRAAGGAARAARRRPLPQALDRGARPGSNRVLKVLETANIKLGSVVANVLGVSARAMLKALLAAAGTPDELPHLAQRSLWRKRPVLAEALTGRITAHHRFMLDQL